MPLTRASFSPEQTKTFFDGLLPEGFTRRCVASWMHVDENDYLSILAGLGHECFGAVRIVAQNSPYLPPDKSCPEEASAIYNPQILLQRLDIQLSHFPWHRIFPHNITDLHDAVVILLVVPERNSRKFIAVKFLADDPGA